MLRRLLAAGGLVAAALVIGVMLMEGVLRLAGVSYPDFFRDDPVIGRGLRPGASGWWTSEGHSWVQVNSDGQRDREHARVASPDSLRIAVLGDSYAAAFEVPAEAAFWSVMQRKLEGCPAAAGRKIEVINFGVGGAGTAAEYLMLQDRVWKYGPQIVLLAFLTGNDVSDNSRALKRSGRSPYFVYDAAGQLVLDPAFVEKRASLTPDRLDDLWSGLLNRSRVLQVVMQAWRQAKLIRQEHETAPGNQAEELGLDHQIYAQPTQPVWQEAWRMTEDLLRAINAEVLGHGARFALASLSNGIQVHPDPDVRSRYAGGLGVDDLLYPDRRIEALARFENIPFHMLAPDLRDWAAANGACVHGFTNATPCYGHWNVDGHRVAGERLATWLCDAVIARVG